MLLLLVKPVMATEGLGIGPAKLEIDVSPTEEHLVYIFLFNPSDQDSDVNLSVYCANCVQDFKILGYALGKVNYSVDFIEVIPSSLLVEKNTSVFEGEYIVVSIRMPLFIKKELRFSGNRSIFYHTLISSIDDFDIRVVAETGKIMKISVVSYIKINVRKNIVYTLITISLIILFVVIIFLAKSKKPKSRKRRR